MASTLTLRDAYGNINIAALDPAAVAELSDAAQACLVRVISAHDDRAAATERHRAAMVAVRAAQEEQANALEAHRVASDPFPFVKPKIEHYATQVAFDAAMIEARQMHDLRVRSFREIEARKAAVAAYNSSH